MDERGIPITIKLNPPGRRYSSILEKHIWYSTSTFFERIIQLQNSQGFLCFFMFVVTFKWAFPQSLCENEAKFDKSQCAELHFDCWGNSKSSMNKRVIEERAIGG